MILNNRIWKQTIAAALVAATGNTVWIRAIDRAVKEIERSAYWSFADGVLTIKSLTSGKLYRIDEAHTCEATQGGHQACKHRAAHRLMLRYVARLSAAEAASETAGVVVRSSMLAEANKAILVKRTVKGEKYGGMDI